MQNVQSRTWRRRHWLALCMSGLLAACGGGGASGTAVWDTAAGWDNTNWN